jgi:methylmalonyl-CoA mutase C-terminal domain/subunit
VSRERVIVAILGLDQHETGALAVSSILRDAGMEVIYLGRFASPQTIAATAIDEGVDVVGVSCHSWEYLYSVDELLRLLGQGGGERIPLVVGGSVVTPADGRALREKGVAAVFGPSASADEIVRTVRDLASQYRPARTG